MRSSSLKNQKAMIQVGDRVVCVDAKGHNYSDRSEQSGLIEGREYIVYDIVDSCCGQDFDVGLRDRLCTSKMGCPHCKSTPIKPNPEIWYAGAWRFRKVEERTIEYTVDVKIEIPEPCLS